MATGLTPLLTSSIAFAYVSAVVLLTVGVVLSVRRGRLHPVLLAGISAISFSWIEAPYDWAMYAQFPEAIPRMPAWWPLNLTWGGLPSSVPLGYVSYFVLPPLLAVAIGRRLSAHYGWRRPITLLNTGLVVGFLWALVYNGGLGGRLGVFAYGRVIPGLALWEGTTHQYPLYDALALGIQAMVFTYLLGRTDDLGRTVIEMGADAKARTRRGAAALSIAGFVLVGNLTYGLVFAPHLVTKLGGYVTSGPSGQIFDGVENQPLHGGT